MDDFDKEFYGDNPPQSKREPADVPAPRPSTSITEEFDRDFYGPGRAAPVTTAPGARPSGAPPVSTTPTATQTRVPTQFQKARTAPAPTDPELTVGEASQRALRNLPSSTMGVISNLATAVTNPQQTFEGFKQLGRGVLSKAKGAVGVKQTPEEIANDEAILNEFIDQNIGKYGSKQGFLKAFSEDPASVLMDLSTVLTGGASAAGKAGLIGAKAAQKIASKAALLDPIQLAVKTAKGVGSVGAGAGRLASSVATGVSPEFTRLATEVGAKGTAEQQAIFRAMQKDPNIHGTIVDEAETAVKEAAKKRSDNYMAGMKGLPSAHVDYTESGRKVADLRDEFIQKMQNGPDVVLNEKAVETADRIENLLTQFASQPLGSEARTIIGADRLKKAIGNIQQDVRSNSQAYRVATEMYNEVRKALTSADPNYLKVMGEYESMSDFLSEVRQSFGIGRRVPDATVLKRLTKASTGPQKQLLQDLSEFNPNLRYAIAGAATSEWVPGGIRQALLGSLPFYAPAQPLAAAAHLAASSPRVAGSTAYALGKAGKQLGRATQQKFTTPAYYLGRAGEQVAGGVPPEAAEKSPYEQYLGPVVPEEGQTGSTDSVFNRMLQIESGGSQVDGKGETWVSPKGAIGIAQVMPSTGPEAARLAGEEWDENRLRNDENYNRRLGRAYFEKQLRTFRDPLLAAAAYNAGPGAVQKALENAERSGEPWIKFLPLETQEYVRKVNGGIQVATGGRIERASGGRVNNVDSLVDELMGKFRKAKKETDKTTEPLLNAPDEHIVKALDVAQQAI